MKNLRRKLRMSISEFAKLLGMNFAVLQSRELEIVPWQPGEVDKAKRKVASHLATATSALAVLNP